MMNQLPDIRLVSDELRSTSDTLVRVIVNDPEKGTAIMFVSLKLTPTGVQLETVAQKKEGETVKKSVAHWQSKLV